MARNHEMKKVRGVVARSVRPSVTLRNRPRDVFRALRSGSAAHPGSSARPAVRIAGSRSSGRPAPRHHDPAAVRLSCARGREGVADGIRPDRKYLLWHRPALAQADAMKGPSVLSVSAHSPQGAWNSRRRADQSVRSGTCAACGSVAGGGKGRRRVRSGTRIRRRPCPVRRPREARRNGRNSVRN